VDDEIVGMNGGRPACGRSDDRCTETIHPNDLERILEQTLIVLERDVQVTEKMFDIV
jgi:hypothetical protein